MAEGERTVLGTPYAHAITNDAETASTEPQAEQD